MSRYYFLDSHVVANLNQLANLDPETLPTLETANLVQSLSNAQTLATNIHTHQIQAPPTQQALATVNETINTLHQEIAELTTEGQNLQTNATRQRTEIDRLNRVIDIIQPLAAQPPRENQQSIPDSEKFDGN